MFKTRNNFYKNILTYLNYKNILNIKKLILKNIASLI